MVRHAVPFQSHFDGSGASFLVVFHGTTLGRAGDIFWDGRLRADAARIWPGTPPGYVYVTSRLTEAVDYARKAVMREGRARNRATPIGAVHLGLVFALGVPATIVEPDPDDQEYEQGWQTRGAVPRTVNSLRIARDIPLNEDGWWAWVNTSARVRQVEWADLRWSPARMERADWLQPGV